MVSIDDWGHGEDNPVPVEDNWIDRFVAYDRQIVTQVTVFLYIRNLEHPRNYN